MSKPTSTTLEDAFAKLEATIGKLESEQGDLQASMTAFEEGVASIRNAQKILEAATQRVNVLLTDDSKDSHADDDTELTE